MEGGVAQGIGCRRNFPPYRILEVWSLPSWCYKGYFSATFPLGIEVVASMFGIITKVSGFEGEGLGLEIIVWALRESVIGSGEERVQANNWVRGRNTMI